MSYAATLDTGGMDTTTLPPTTQPIEIFRAGTHTALNGHKYTFTTEQLREVAEFYDPAFADAPAVIGHPTLTAPRWGRAATLSVTDDGVLLANLEQVVPDFAAAVARKNYTNVSASFYMPDAPGNPKPGKTYLRHIGFLGGAAPAVKGLEQVAFGADVTGVADFAYADTIVARIFRRIKNWVIARDGEAAADNLISEYELEHLNEAAQAEPDPAFAAPPHVTITPLENDLDKDQLAAQQAALAAQQAALEKREAALALQEQKARLQGNAEFAESLVAAGKLLPKQKDTVIAVFAELDGVKGGVVEFAADDGRVGKTGKALLQELLGALPKQVEFARLAPDATDVKVVDFAVPPGFSVDGGEAATVRKAQQYQAEQPGVDFMTAVQAVQA